MGSSIKRKFKIVSIAVAIGLPLLFGYTNCAQQGDLSGAHLSGALSSNSLSEAADATNDIGSSKALSLASIQYQALDQLTAEDVPLDIKIDVPNSELRLSIKDQEVKTLRLTEDELETIQELLLSYQQNQANNSQCQSVTPDIKLLLREGKAVYLGSKEQNCEATLDLPSQSRVELCQMFRPLIEAQMATVICE